MEKCDIIWHIELYNEYGERVDDIYFAREEVAREYIEAMKEMWTYDDLDWNFGGETLWL